MEMVNNMGLIEEYLNEHYLSDKAKHDEAEQIRIKFVADFPIDNIYSLTMEEYLIAKEGYGNRNSFCRRMLYDLRPLSSMGNVRFDVFGIYLKDGINISLSKTFENIFDDNFEAAFSYIKGSIRDLLINVGLEKYEAIKECKLNRSFIYKLISVYYPNRFVPVGTARTLNQYCDRLGLKYDDSEEMIYRNLKLVDWKLHQPETENWENWLVMTFCDWLWRSDKRLVQDSANTSQQHNERAFNDINIAVSPRAIYEEGDIINVICLNCGNKFIKALRCPICGQLQKYEE